MPGSNWHAYVYDPDGHTNELYYGIEQVGWEGYSKPRTMYDRGFREAPELPQINEFQEVQDALAEGIDLESGYRYVDELRAEVRRAGRDAAAALQDHPHRARRHVRRRPRRRCGLLPRHAGLRHLGGDAAGRRARRAHAQPTRSTTRWRCCPDVAASEAGHERAHDFGVLRRAAGQLPPAQRRLRLPRGERRARRPQPAGRRSCPAWTTSRTPSTRTATASSSTTTWSRSAGTARCASRRSAGRLVAEEWPATLEPLPDSYNGEPFLGPWG